MSSFVPHPHSTPTLPLTQQSSTEKCLLHNNEPSSSPQQGGTETDGSGLHNNKEGVEVIMIDDVSSNEGVMEQVVSETVSQTAVSVDESFPIDLEQDDDSNMILSKFVDQSSDSSSAE